VKVVLIAPPYETPAQQLFTMKEIGYLQAMLERDGWPVEIVDCDRLGVADAARRIADIQPVVVGLPIQWRDTILKLGEEPIVQALRLAGVSAHYSATGLLATIFYRSLLENLPQLDSVVLGESELTFLNLVRAVGGQQEWSQMPGIAHRTTEGEIVANLPAPRVTDLDTLPFPARDYLADRARFPMAAVESSRGCSWHCIFCRLGIYAAIHEGALWRGRSARNVVDEIEQVVETFGIRSFYFVDDNFLEQEAHGRAIAQELLRRGLRIGFSIECNVTSVQEDLFLLLRQAGLRKVGLGLESGAQSVLDRYEKKTTVADNRRAVALLQRLGINCEPAMILFDPLVSLEEIRETVDFYADTRLHLTTRMQLPFFHHMMVYPGTTARERFISMMEPLAIGPDLAQQKPWLAAPPNLLLDWATNRYRFLDPRVQVLWETKEYHTHQLAYHRRVLRELRRRPGEFPEEEREARQILNREMGQWRANIEEQYFVLLRETEKLLRPLASPQEEHSRQIEALVQRIIKEFDRRFFGQLLAQRVQELGLRIEAM